MYIVQHITVHVLDRKPELVQAVLGEGKYNYVHVQHITVHVLDRKPELEQAVLGEGKYNYVHCTL